MLNQMKKYVGQVFQVKIININEEEESLIVSEKAVSDEIAELKTQKNTVLVTLSKVKLLE
jgi:ribosomal protein S1